MKVQILKGDHQINILNTRKFGGGNIELVKSHRIYFELSDSTKMDLFLSGLNLPSSECSNLENLEIYKSLVSQEDKDLLKSAASLGFSYRNCIVLTEEQIDLINNYSGGDNFDINNIKENLIGKHFWDQVDSNAPAILDPKETNFIDNKSQEYIDQKNQCSIDNPDDCEMCGS